ncbi:BatA domain-containing protein [Fulvivirga ligni]|uniref:BatA domain-containing protein n=1 Tax=Fulvivirga ligni TaxID=2904246 RepID=UPI001F2BA8A1|nr:BatA domain-containing protein [Fulvivirga ligni]UII24308.1 BatA domain-containing protein [Fulvivirga ligni]
MLNFSLAYPGYLWGFLALLVPLAIHLLSKQQGKIIKIGSIELLQEVDSKQTRTIRLNELLLLILRCILISIIVLFLAGLQLRKESSPTSSKAYLIEPELFSDENVKDLADSLIMTQEVRLFSDQFEVYDPQKNYTDLPTPDYWNLVNHLNEIEPDSLIIFTASRYNGVTGKRPTTNKNIHWIEWNKNDSIKAIVAAYQVDSTNVAIVLTSDSAKLNYKQYQWTGENSPQGIQQQDDEVRVSSDQPWIPMKEMEPVRVSIQADEVHTQQAMLVRAALLSIKKEVPLNIKISDQEPDVAFWLSEKPYSMETEKVFLLRPDSLATELISSDSKAGEYIITQNLNLQKVLRYRLAETIANLISPIKYHSAKYDMRTIPLSEWTPSKTAAEKGKATDKASFQSLEEWLALLFIIILIIERSFSWARKQ